MDVLVDQSGKATALIIGVGGFLGAGEKDVAVPFNAVQFTNKNNNKWYLVMNATKDALKDAKGFKYDRSDLHIEDCDAVIDSRSATVAADRASQGNRRDLDMAHL
jgi:PRC-barrel domain